MLEPLFCIRRLRAVLEKSRKQLLTKPHLFIHLYPVSQTIQVRWQDMQDITGDARSNLCAKFSHEPLHKDVLALDEQQRLT